MDLNQIKPIHLKCPKCSYDFSYNTNDVEEKIDMLGTEIMSIKNQLTQFKQSHNKIQCDTDKWYQGCKKAMIYKQAQLAQYKKARKATAVEIRLQVFNNYRRHIRQLIGDEAEMKLIKECEEEMIYFNYDTATQTFNRFEKA